MCIRDSNNTLAKCKAEWVEHAALGVVAASAVYPASASKGDLITGLDSKFSEHIKVFHAGTSIIDNKVVTAGGRVLCVTALGETVVDAKKYAYKAIENITYEGMFFRNDIGHRAVTREN